MLKHRQPGVKIISNRTAQKISARLKLVLTTLLGAFLVLAPLQAKDEVKVIALVNGEPVTNLELAERLSYLRRVAQLKVVKKLYEGCITGVDCRPVKIQFGKNVVPELIPKLNGTARQILDENCGVMENQALSF